jgi:hypothetical protein
VGGKNFWDASSSDSEADSDDFGDDYNDQSADGAPPTPPPRNMSLLKNRRDILGASDPHMWRESDVAAWLESHGLGSHADGFQNQRIDGPALLAISHELSSVDWHTASEICASTLGITRVGECAKFRQQVRELLRNNGP